MNFQLATLEKLQNQDKEVPCIYDGTEFIPQIPKDNECTFEYLRELDTKIENKDTGGCYAMPNKKRFMRYVFFSSSRQNPEKAFADFWQRVRTEKTIELTAFSYDQSKVAKAETTEYKNIVVKDFTYIYVDFNYTANTTNCPIDC